MRHALRMILWVAVAVWAPGTLSAQTLNLDFSTYLGGVGDDQCYRVALDSMNQVYMTGATRSSDFPTFNSYQATYNWEALGTPDAWVGKLSSSGSVLLFSTYLGGGSANGFDIGRGIAVDSVGQACVAGYTYAAEFPTLNPFQSSSNGDVDMFVSLISSSGSSLLFSTYLGGSDADYGNALALDSLNRACVAGNTSSSDFPTRLAYQATYAGGYYDVCLSRLSSSGSELVFSTYLGGGDYDSCKSISLDPAGRVHIAGSSSSADFPTANAFQSSNAGEQDAFVGGFSSSGSMLIYSTYLGGQLYDNGSGVSTDSAGRVYVAGLTACNDFPTRNAYQPSRAGAYDCFICCLASTGSALVYSTYLGGGASDYAEDIDCDSSRRAQVVGYTYSTDFPAVCPYQSSNAGAYDIFVSQIASSGASLDFSTYWGGSGTDQSDGGVALDASNRVYITGTTSSSDFPTASAYQPSNAGGSDACLARFSYITPAGGRVCDSGDYNGDGTDDIAIYRGSSGLWSVRDLTRVYFGGSTDYVVPADYSGDGTTDVAVWRWSDGQWSVRNLTRFYLGAGNDLPVPGDYSGNGTAVAGIFRGSSGLWSIRDLTRVYLGSSGDTIVPGYYSPGGSKDIAIYRPSEGLWSIRNLTRIYFGQSNDSLVPGDYDGSGQWAAGVFRRPESMWAIRDLTRFYVGTILDLGVPADYDGDGRDEAGIFRSVGGLWAIRDLTRAFFGSAGDLPATR